MILSDSEIERNVQNIILPLDRLSGPLDFAWGAFKILYTVRQNNKIADAYIKVIVYFCHLLFRIFFSIN